MTSPSSSPALNDDPITLEVIRHRLEHPRGGRGAAAVTPVPAAAPAPEESPAAPVPGG